MTAGITGYGKGSPSIPLSPNPVKHNGIPSSHTSYSFGQLIEDYTTGYWYLYAGGSTFNQIYPNGAGILSVSGTANQVTATNLAGAITVSLPVAIVAPGSVTATTTLTATLGNITATNGNLVLNTAGNKIVSTSVGTTTAAGANSFGSVTLVGGTATVSTTSVTANSLIQIWRQSPGATGAAAIGNLSVGTIVAGTSFVINALDPTDSTALIATDVSVVGWVIIN